MASPAKKAKRKQRRLMQKVDSLIAFEPKHVTGKRTRNLNTCAKAKASSIPRPMPNQTPRINAFKCSLGKYA